MVTGNVGNGLVVGAWDVTDAVLALPLDATGANAVWLWFDQAFVPDAFLLRPADAYCLRR